MKSNIWLLKIALIVLFLIFPLVGYLFKESKRPFDFCSQTSIRCLEGKIKMKMVTTKGTIIIELNGDSAPLTAFNFLNLAQRGLYNQTLFNRVIKEPFPFIIQGGYKEKVLLNYEKLNLDNDFL